MSSIQCGPGTFYPAGCPPTDTRGPGVYHGVLGDGSGCRYAAQQARPCGPPPLLLDLDEVPVERGPRPRRVDLDGSDGEARVEVLELE